MDGITPNAMTGDVNLVAGSGITIDTVGMPPYTWRVYSAPLPFVGNIEYLTGARASPNLSPDDPTLQPGSDTWQALGCGYYPSFNGNTCGWSAPDSGTYLVHVAMTITFQISPFIAAISPHFSLGVSVSNPFNSVYRIIGESPATIIGLDSVSLSETRSAANIADVTLGGTVVIQGAGMFTGGCLTMSGLPTCGYGLEASYKFTMDTPFNGVDNPRFLAVVVRYTWSRIN